MDTYDNNTKYVTKFNINIINIAFLVGRLLAFIGCIIALIEMLLLPSKTLKGFQHEPNDHCFQ